MYHCFPTSIFSYNSQSFAYYSLCLMVKVYCGSNISVSTAFVMLLIFSHTTLVKCKKKRKEICIFIYILSHFSIEPKTSLPSSKDPTFLKFGVSAILAPSPKTGVFLHFLPQNHSFNKLYISL